MSKELAAEMFAERYHIQKLHITFLRLEKRLRNTNSFCNKHEIRRRNMTNNDNAANVLAAVNANPQTSTRQLTNGISRTSI